MLREREKPNLAAQVANQGKEYSLYSIFNFSVVLIIFLSKEKIR